MRVFNAVAVLAARVLLPLLTVSLLACGSAGAAPVRLLAIGDSLTAGYGLPPEDSFAAKLQSALTALHVAAVVVNGGVSGETSAGGLATLDWQLADKPDFAILELGANDMLRGLPPAETRRNLAEILTRLKSAQIPTLLCGMRAATNWGSDYAQPFDAIYPELARQFGTPLYPFFLEGVALDPTLVQADGLHPNAAGVDVIVKRIMPSVLDLLKAPR